MLREEEGDDWATESPDSLEVVIEIENLPPQIKPTLESNNFHTDKMNCTQSKQKTEVDTNASDIADVEIKACAAANPSLPIKTHIEKCIQSHCSVL